MALTVGDVMVKNVIAVHSDQTVRHAALVMSAKEIGCLVVLEENRVVGIVTERDLIRRIIAARRDPDETFVSDIMSTPPVAAKPELVLEDAVKLMLCTGSRSSSSHRKRMRKRSWSDWSR
jgi:CBS domain-containing protein